MADAATNFERATIENLTTHEKVTCHFNPYEYTLTKSNQWDSKDAKGVNVPKVKFNHGGAESLKIQLLFDTYNNGRGDVREWTGKLLDMMMVSPDKKNQRNNKSEPPHVEFQWGKFQFKAVIASITQKFTLFDKEGLPLRATVDVTFQQVEDPQSHSRQNPTSGGGPPMKIHIVQSGERLDLIAYKVYGDAAQWRLIAQANNLRHPLHLRDGQQLLIPPVE
jgi:nucleoid-associated protein YgaU